MNKDAAMSSLADRVVESAGDGASPRPPGPLVMPQIGPESPGARASADRVRAFCLTGRDASGTLERADESMLPALLHAMREPGFVRTGEPIVLLHGQGPAAMGFGDWLAGAIAGAFPADGSARELRDNAVRLERAARAEAGPGIAGLKDLLRASVESVIHHGAMHASAAESLRRDAASIAGTLDPRDGFLTIGDGTGIALLLHAARRRSSAARKELFARVRALRDRLERMLVNDARRGAGGESVAGGLGTSEAFDPAALERVLGRPRGPVGMGVARRKRVEGLLERLDAILGERVQRSHVVVADRAHAAAVGSAPDIELIESDTPCAEAGRRWAALADSRLDLFLAMRMAALEVEDRYDESVHGAFEASFTRELLSEDEVRALPTVIAVESVSRLRGADMPHLVRSLLSGRPLRVLVEVEAGAEMPVEAGASRFEAGLFGVGLGSALVHQSSVSAPEHLVGGFERALGSSGPSLHVVASGRCAGGAEAGIGRWMHAGAAVDARAHPLFVYDPRGGWSLADRFDFSGNEQPAGDWPEHEASCVDAGGVDRMFASEFCPADFALLEPACGAHFRVIPPECPTADLAGASELIDADWPGDRRIPFVWGAGADGTLVRVVVTRALIEACRDRLATWRTLQQFAGVRDVYADRAAAAEREKARHEAGETMARVKGEHAAEVERIRREEASSVLDRLARSIMGVDPAGLLSAPRAAPPAPARAPAEPGGVSVDAPAAPAPEEDTGLDEPYIDSVLCTSCNDCININPRLFRYNANKQAEIGDPDAGSFRELVTAAEKCPARCIHPGKPRNPGEARLDELVERAKKFR